MIPLAFLLRFYLAVEAMRRPLHADERQHRRELVNDGAGGDGASGRAAVLLHGVRRRVQPGRKSSQETKRKVELMETERLAGRKRFD